MSHAGLLSSRHGESRFGRLGIPSDSGYSRRALTSVPLIPTTFVVRRGRYIFGGGNMKYVRRSVRQAGAEPIAVCERQCEYIDAGLQAPPIRSRGQIACIAAWKPGPGNMRNEPRTSLSNGGLADSRGAAGRSPNSVLLNHCIVGGPPFGGSLASKKSNGRRER